MELVFSIVKFLFLGFVSLIALLVIVVLVFGKRIKKAWELEADLVDAAGRKFGEFEIESSRIVKQEADYTLKPKLLMRHPSLEAQTTVSVYVDDVLVVEGPVEKAGRIRLDRKHLRNEPEGVTAGQVCRVVVGGSELARAALRPD